METFDEIDSFLADSEFFSIDDEPEPEQKQKKENQTSDKLSKNAKRFMDENKIRGDIYNKPTFQIIKKVLHDLRLPKRGEQIRIRTQQQINLLSMILKIIDVHKKIDELTVATYTFNRFSMETFSALLKAKAILKLNLLISSSYEFRDKKYCQELKEFALTMNKKYSVHLCLAWAHFKITLVKCGDDFYQIEGSMNYSTNNMAEQLLFENSKETYDYDYKFIKEVILKNKNKALEIIC